MVTLFFSMPQSKLVGYILPVAFPLAYLIGDSAAPLGRTAGVAGQCRALAVLICLAT